MIDRSLWTTGGGPSNAGRIEKGPAETPQDPDFVPNVESSNLAGRRTLSARFSKRCFLLSNDRPLRRHFGVQLCVTRPLFRHIVFMEDGLNRALGYAGFAVDTFLRMNDENGFTFVEALHRTNDDAVRVFAVETWFCNNMGHIDTLSIPSQ